MNNIITSFLLGLSMLRKTKLRSSLTVFGITIGIGMVIVVFSAGEGVRGIITDQISSFGDNWIDIEIKVPETKKNSQKNASDLAHGVNITTLKKEDADAIKKLNNIQNAYAGITTQAVLAYQNEKIRPMIFGVTASYLAIDKSALASGRFFTESEDMAASQVVVIGSEVEDVLFGNNNPIGKIVKIEGKPCEVIGSMEKLGNAGFFNRDKMVYLPLQTTQKKLMGVEHILFIIAQTRDNTKAENTAEEIRYLVRERHNIPAPEKDDFSVTTMKEATDIVDTILTAITWLLIALAAISLLVGGVGIMNVMYVSVAERTFEIGLRKATGATTTAILSQFLIEAVVLTVAGGIAGVLLGSAVAYGIAAIARYMHLAWSFTIPFFSIVLGVSFSMAVGILFGLYPAKKAAHLHPIDALRME